MPLPLNVSCFSRIQIGFTFLVPAHPGSPRKGPLNGVCVCVCVLSVVYCFLVSADSLLLTTIRFLALSCICCVFIIVAVFVWQRYEEGDIQ